MSEPGIEPEILFEQRGQLGLITLNRPKAMNALTYGMVKALDAQLDDWALDDSVHVVAIQGAGDKAFAAGGDIRALYDTGQGGKTGDRNFQFFADEYRLNTRIKRYPKPYVGIMDGVVMGGGVGVSIHGSHRFVTERTMFAMPETGIGLFPDVGATYFLPRMDRNVIGAKPGSFGLLCGLTGARLKLGDASVLLNADLIASDEIENLLEALADPERIAVLQSNGRNLHDALGLTAPGSETLNTMPHLDAKTAVGECFDRSSVEEINASLDRSQTQWAAGVLKTLASKSPTSTRIAFRQIREGARLSFEDCMRLEYRLARYCMTHPDFYEGVRAVILDKDNAPQWSPATLAEATDDFIAEAFAPLGADELQL